MLARFVGIAALAGLAAGCGGDETTGPQASQITGLWTATQVQYVRVAPPAMSVDLIALGGAATMEIRTDQVFVFALAESGQPPDTTTGTWKLDGEFLEITPAGMPFSWTWKAVLAGNSLQLTGADMEFDFDGDDVAEPAKQNTTLVR